MQWWGWTIVIVTAMGAVLTGLVYSYQLAEMEKTKNAWRDSAEEGRKELAQAQQDHAALLRKHNDTTRKLAAATANFDTSDRELAAAKQALDKIGQELAAMTGERDAALEKAKAVDYWKSQAEDARAQVKQLTSPTGGAMDATVEVVEPKKARAKSA